MKIGIKEANDPGTAVLPHSGSQRYVVGFLFNREMSRVALIRKKKPEWQAGLLNGIGGKIEDGEEPMTAMIREFSEESEYTGDKIIWELFCVVQGTNSDGSSFSVHCFYGFGDPDAVIPKEAEIILAYWVSDVVEKIQKSVGNVPWLLCLAKDFGQGVHPPKMVRVEY